MRTATSNKEGGRGDMTALGDQAKWTSWKSTLEVYGEIEMDLQTCVKEQGISGLGIEGLETEPESGDSD